MIRAYSDGREVTLPSTVHASSVLSNMVDWSLLRKAMEDYETKMFLAQAKNITLGDMQPFYFKEKRLDLALFPIRY